MFAITKQKPKRGVWHAEVASAPRPRAGEVTIAVTKAGICGTDYHIYTWDAWSAGRVPMPMTIGHEFVGRIVAIGPGVTHLEIGRRVSAECHIACGVCVQCRTGNAHICADVKIVGVDRPGCFAETITVPAANVWCVPDEIPDRHAAIYDPIGNAMHATSTVSPSGKDVLVIGAGTIGLFAAAICRAEGARRVIVQEPNAYRSGLARSLGVDLVLDPHEADSEKKLLEATDGLGPNTVLEMSGSGAALAAALRLARNGAHVSLMGLPGAPVQIELAEHVIMKGLTLHGVTGRRMYDTWYRTQAFMLRNPALIDAIVTHVLPAREYLAGFRLMDEGACGKVILDFEAQQAALQ